LRTHEMFTALNVRATYTIAIYLQLLPTAGFCLNADRRDNDQ